MARFRYPLDAMLKQCEWEIDAVRVELVALNQVLAARQAEVQQLARAVEDAEQQILDMCKESAVIALDRKVLVETYLRDQRQQMHAKQQELEQTNELVNSVFQQLSKKRQSQRGIEKHRERKKTEFDGEVLRKEALESDELWLAKIGSAK